MKSINRINHYFLLVNFSLLISFSMIYSNFQTFNVNFEQLQRSALELLVIFNFLNLIVYLTVNYIYRFESRFIHFVIVLSITFVFAILLLWVFKFVNVSRLFLLVFYLLFYISAIITTRKRNNISNDIYMTFDKSLATTSEKMIYANEDKFPDDFLNQASNLLKKKNLKGIVYNDSLNRKFKLEDIIEISNFLGVDVLEKKKDKLNLIHKSTNINKPLKNFEDVILLILLGIPLIILTLIFSILVFIFQGRPIFFKQIRVGENGNYFKIYKFRTMNNNKLSTQELNELNQRDKIVFKSNKDPRITKLGKFLRKSSIDELPQIINIFKNEMSFIGPRPPIVEEVSQYELKHLKRISIKPGITGLWQVTLRQDNSFDNWVEKDIEYIENWNIFLDIKIILLTFREIYKLTGE